LKHKESEVLARLDKEGLWTKKDEDLIKSHDERIEHLNSSKKNAMTESQNSFFQEKIKEEKGKKIILECKKKALIGTTCETYRDSQMSKYFILSLKLILIFV
jgi:CRISPR/Cas system-associated endoribonuclease Cas2